MDAPSFITEYDRYLKNIRSSEYITKYYIKYLEHIIKKRHWVDSINNILIDDGFKVVLNNNMNILYDYLDTYQYASGNVKRKINFSLKTFYIFCRKVNLINDETIDEIMIVLKGTKWLKTYNRYIESDRLDEIITFLNAYYFIPNPYKIKAIIYFMYYTGMNYIDIRNLTRDKIDLEKRRVYLKSRVVFFNHKLKKTIEDYFNTEPEIKNAFNLTRHQTTLLMSRIKRYKVKKVPVTLNRLKECFFIRNLKKCKNPLLIQTITGRSMKGLEQYYEKDLDKLQKQFDSL
jgi:integrase